MTLTWEDGLPCSLPPSIRCKAGPDTEGPIQARSGSRTPRPCSEARKAKPRAGRPEAPGEAQDTEQSEVGAPPRSHTPAPLGSLWLVPSQVCPQGPAPLRPPCAAPSHPPPPCSRVPDQRCTGTRMCVRHTTKFPFCNSMYKRKTGQVPLL